jgi:hypothetical protein
MACRPRLLSFLLFTTAVLAPLASSKPVDAFVPPDGTDPSSGAGGSAGAAEPPLSVYLDRYTYFVGEIVTGALDCPSCSADGPIFQDAQGNQITGTIIYDEVNYGAFAFIPDLPLQVGIYSVNLGYASTGFEVVEGESLPPTFEAVLAESPSPVGDPIECQATVPGYTGTYYPQSRIDAALGISLVGMSADQYQYEYSLDGGERISTSAVYPLATFREGNGEFCIEVFAIPYAASPEFSLGTVCLDPDVELDLGVKDEPYGSLDSLLAGCEIPPDGFMDDWCAYHAEAFARHSCSGFIEAACLEARYECPDGDLPEWFDENGINPDGTGGTGNGGSGTGATGSGATNAGTGGSDGVDVDGSDSGNDTGSSEAGGCSCRLGSAKSRGSGDRAFLVFGLLGALIALRKHERKLLK